MDEFRRPIAIAAMLGFAGSLVWHLFALRGIPFPAPLAVAFFVGVFVVFFPTIFYLQRFKSVLGQGADLTAAWKHIVRGAPPWTIVLAVMCFAYGMLNFFLATGAPVGRVSGKDLAWDRVGSGHAMVFYSFVMVVMFAALARDDEPELRCERGHSMLPGTDFCEQCGARAQKPPLRAKS